MYAVPLRASVAPHFSQALFSSSATATVHSILSLPCGEPNRQKAWRVKYFEIIADNLKEAGWSLGWVSDVDCSGRTIWIVDAHRGDGKRFVVHADEMLTAFLELEATTCTCGALCLTSN